MLLLYNIQIQNMIVILMILIYLLEEYLSKLSYNRPKVDTKKNALLVDESLIKIFLESNQPEPAF